MFYPGFFFDPTMIILIPGLLLGFFAQMRVKSTFARYKNVHNKAGFTGAQTARRILDAYKLHDVAVVAIAGELSDHYDPVARRVSLSDDIYHGRSVASLGIAAHECGHAIQHAQAYLPLTFRTALFPVVSICSSSWTIIFGIGLLMSFMGVVFGSMAIKLAIVLFSVVILFQLVTLPVEFNASSRAMSILTSGGFLSDDEVSGSRKVLNAAALTYVAGLVMSVLQLIRMLAILQGTED